MNDRRLIRTLLAVIFPPLAVLERGCGTALLVGVLTLAGWLPGVIVALVLVWMEPADAVDDGPERRYIQLEKAKNAEKPKRQPSYIRLQDGEVAEITEEDSN